MRHQLFIFITVFIFAVTGCSGGYSPTTPSDLDKSPPPELAQITSDTGTSRYKWGYWHCTANKEDGTISAEPARSADLHVNILKSLNNALKLTFELKPGSNPGIGYFVIDMVITHPFPGMSTFTAFDLKGIILSNGSLEAGGLRFPGSNDLEVQNADGFTRWWNPSEFTDAGFLGYVKGNFAIEGPGGPPTSMINPYKLFGDGLMSQTEIIGQTLLPLTDPNGRAVFRAGNTNRREYKIQFPWSGGPILYFDYAVDCSWDLPDPDPPVIIPNDFPIKANAEEPFLVLPVVTNTSVVGTEYGGAGAGELELSISVWDWQGWSNGSYGDQIGDVRLYSPNIEFDIPSVTLNDKSNFTTLTVTANANAAKIGTQPVLIEISSPGTLWKQSIQAAPSGNIAAYAFVEIEVGQMDCEADTNVNCDTSVPLNLEDTIVNAVCIPNDLSDFYVFTIPSGQVMIGTITLDNFLFSDNDLILYDGCPGDPIAFSMNPNGVTEIIDVGNIESGTYYIAVQLGETAGENVQSYMLTLDIYLPGGDCTTDTNNDYDVADPIGLVGNYTGSVCAGQDLRDWYKLIVPPNKTAGGTIYLHNNSFGNIDVYIYEEYPGPATYVGDNTGATDEYVFITALGPGIHYVELEALDSDPEGDREYVMDVELYTSGYICSSGDGNDSYLTADVVAFETELSDTVCFPSDPDWYRFTIEENAIASGFITITSGQTADNDLYLYTDPSGEPIKLSADPGQDDEQITLGQLEEGIYYVKVAAHPVVGGGDQQYTLTTEIMVESMGDYDFTIHAHIIMTTDGTSPATTEWRVQNDVDWANEFYSRWDMTITLVEISYIARTSWLAGTVNELYTCHSLFRDKSGPVNVYYVNSFPDIPNALAWARMDCRPMFQTHNSTFISMRDGAINRVLAHELGHALGIFHDIYLLDLGYSYCWQIIQDYCQPGTNWSYCSKNDKQYGNLMYWGVQNWNDPEDYFLSDSGWETPNTPINSQIENLMYFHIGYPNNF